MWHERVKENIPTETDKFKIVGYLSIKNITCEVKYITKAVESKTKELRNSTTECEVMVSSMSLSIDLEKKAAM